LKPLSHLIGSGVETETRRLSCLRVSWIQVVQPPTMTRGVGRGVMASSICPSITAWSSCPRVGAITPPRPNIGLSLPGVRLHWLHGLYWLSLYWRSIECVLTHNNNVVERPTLPEHHREEPADRVVTRTPGCCQVGYMEHSYWLSSIEPCFVCVMWNRVLWTVKQRGEECQPCPLTEVKAQAARARYHPTCCVRSSRFATRTPSCAVSIPSTHAPRCSGTS
jgi:hypothetical protein